MNSFFTSLEKRVAQVDSLLCVGLDPHEQDLEEVSSQAVLDFCLRLVELTVDSAAAFKPNAAFFESLGAEGMRVLGDVIRQIPDDIPVILDVKRGDISSTARAYARAAFETLGADAVTINPYLGQDAVQPFLEYPGKGAFVLCKTSNPGAKELQDLIVLPSRLPLYGWLASLAREWNRTGKLGLVVGATQVDSLSLVREIDPGIWILAPGVGAQGGNLQAALGAGLRSDGLGMLLPISRGISRADDPGKQAGKFRDEIMAVRDSMQRARAAPHQGSLSSNQQAIADQLLKIGCIQFGEFTLKSGKVSPIYIDLRRLIAHPEVLSRIARVYCSMLSRLDFDHLAALPYAGLPIGSAISLVGGWSLVYARKEEKTYGTKARVEGVFSPGDTAVVIDDLITTGGSKLEGISKLRGQGLQVKDIVVLIDRSRRARSDLQKQGYQLQAFMTIFDLLDYYLETGQVDQDLATRVNEFLEEC